jgi:hypothetical protein
MKAKVFLSFVIGLCLVTSSCSLFFAGDPSGSSDEKIVVNSVSLSPTSVTISTGGVAYLKTTVATTASSYTVSYSVGNDTIIGFDGDSSGVTISGKKPGTTTIKADVGGKTAVCIVTVNGTIDANNNPYITLPVQVISLNPGYDRTITATLAGGSLSDMNSFNWVVDNEAVATVSFVGQSANIKAVKPGICKLTCTHPKASYASEAMIIVKDDQSQAKYLTTTQNFVTLQKGGSSQQISVSLVGIESGREGLITWAVDKTGIVDISSNGTKAIVTPKDKGEVKLTITHPDAKYSLSIIVRVVSIVDNVYIDVPSSQVTVSGDTKTTVTVNLMGDSVNSSDIDGYSWSIEQNDCVEAVFYQNTALLTGLKNGTAKLTVSHSKAQYSREIMVVVKDQTTDAVNANCYLTTSETYLRFTETSEDKVLGVQYVGGKSGDENSFQWSIEDPTVAQITPINGSIIARAASVFTNTTTGQLKVKPLKTGETVIMVTHPKVLNPLKILIKVYPQGTSLKESVYIKSENVVGIVKGQSKPFSVELINSTTTGLISWSSNDNSIVSVSGNSTNGIITANNTGECYIEIKHPYAETSKKVLCYVANTQAELDAFKLIYASKLTYKSALGKTLSVDLQSKGLTDAELSNITWSSTDSNIATVNGSGVHAEILPVSVGSVNIRAETPLCSIPVVLSVTVYPEGTNTDDIPEPKYITTERNVYNLNPANNSVTAYVNVVGLPESDYSRITWVNSNTSVVDVVQNGNKAVLTPKGEGTAVIKVSHPLAENTLEIYVRVGSEYVINNPTPVIISASQDVVELVSGGTNKTISINLANGSDTSCALATWIVDNSSIATISASNKTCIVTPKAAGQTQITIHHPEAKYDKKIIVLVQNSESEKSAFKYITTAQNIVNTTPGLSQTLNVRLVGKTSTDIDSDYTWTIDNSSIATIVANGSTAIINGVTKGVARITVKHPSSSYSLEIIVNVLSKEEYSSGTSTKYITTSQNIVEMDANNSKTVTVTLVGGDSSSNNLFNWYIDRPDIVTLTANGNTALVRANSSGEARITITHPDSFFESTIVISVNPAASTNQPYISVSKSIVTMKPGDSDTTVTAKLVGGSAVDYYGFNWTIDRYDVISLTTNMDQGVITPLKEGTATITISHPKTTLKAEIVVRVTEYTKFAFSQANVTTKEGDTIFIPMQVPSFETNYSMNITYSTDNPQICSISGTNKVAQITAITAGTTIVHATAPSGVSADMLVYVRKNDASTGVYLTTSTNVISLKSTASPKEISASLVGGTQAQQTGIIWTVTDPTIISLLGAGPSVQITPKKVGETTIVLSHPDTATTYTIYVQVTGTAQGISINKTYVSMLAGATAELSCTIDNGTTSDYSLLTWTAQKVNGEDIVAILGTQKSVQLYGLKAGQTKIRVTMANGAYAESDVLVEMNKGITISTSSIRLMPNETKRIKYTVIPANDPVSCFTSTADYLDVSVDSAASELVLTGKKEGVTTITLSSSGGSARLSATAAWDYALSIDKSMVSVEPRNPVVITYTANPPSSEISVAIDNTDVASFVVDTANKQVILTPKKEGKASVQIKQNDSGLTRTASIIFSYNQVTLKPSLTYMGSFSNYAYSTNKLYLGDGETVDLKLGFAEPNIDFTLKSAILEKNNTALNSLSVSGNVITVQHKTDLKVSKDYYYVPKLYSVQKANFSTGHYTYVYANTGAGRGSFSYSGYQTYNFSIYPDGTFEGDTSTSGIAALVGYSSTSTASINSGSCEVSKGFNVSQKITSPGSLYLTASGVVLTGDKKKVYKFSENGMKAGRAVYHTFNPDTYSLDTTAELSCDFDLWYYNANSYATTLVASDVYVLPAELEKYSYTLANTKFYGSICNAMYPNRVLKTIASSDTSIQSIVNADTLVITLLRNGKEEAYRIPVYVVTRDCPANQTATRPDVE